LIRAALPALRKWLCPDPLAHTMDAAGRKARATEKPGRRPRTMKDLRPGTVFGPDDSATGRPQRKAPRPDPLREAVVEAARGTMPNGPTTGPGWEMCLVNVPAIERLRDALAAFDRGSALANRAGR